MMYQALYRKWRPKVFDDVIGQEHITSSLKNQVISGHLSHAYIFIGSRGTGKTTCARILANAVNCEHPVNGSPCGECEACRTIAEGGAIDIVELDAASNNGVDNVRALRDEAVFSPAALKKRVYIIDEVHMLSGSAFNALLKILEEPPEHLMFILATTELQKVPATILSRCQRHSFKRVDSSVLSRHLLNIASLEGLSLTENAADLIAGLAEGGVRDALSMLDQCSSFGSIDINEVYGAMGLIGNKRTLQLFERIINRDTEFVVSEFNSLFHEGKDPAGVLRELSSLIRDVLVMKVAPKGADSLVYAGYDGESLRRFCACLSAQELIAMLDCIQSALGSMKDRLNPKMTAELCLVSLCSGVAETSLSGLAARVERLESGMVSQSSAIPAKKMQTPVILPDPVSPPPEEPMPIAAAKPFIAEAVSKSEEKAFAPAIVPDEPPAAKDPLPGETAQAGEIERAADENFSKLLVKNAGKRLRMGDRVILEDSSSCKISLKEDTLLLEVVPGFFFTSLSKVDVLEVLSEEASLLAGRKIKARVETLKAQQATGNLNDLRQFPEVKFI